MATIAAVTTQLASAITLTISDNMLHLDNLNNKGFAFISTYYFMVGLLDTWKAFNHNTFIEVGAVQRTYVEVRLATD